MSTRTLSRTAIALTFVTVAPAAAAAQQGSHDHAHHGATAPAAKPVAKPATKPATKPAARQAAKPVARPRTSAAASSGAAQRDRGTTSGVPARGAPADSASRSSGHAGHQHTATPATPATPAMPADTGTARSVADTAGTTALIAPTAPIVVAPHHVHGASGAPATSTTPAPSRTAPAAHAMWMRELGRGWQLMGMAQVFPTMTAASARTERSLLGEAGLYATQPAAMFNVASPGSRFVLRTTLNFEELTQENGELTYGGWGEGFIDARHPHTLVHEAMLTANFWNVGGGALSLSAGKGFAPYGTDDPMGRPALKFPTNHHLSQVLERFTVNGTYLWKGWGIEAGVFGGAEPEDAYDFSNIESFGDSWSARLSRRFGDFGPFAAWELSTSFARIAEEHHGETETTQLANAAARHAQAYGFGRVYALVEASRSDPERGRGHYSVLGETQLSLGRGWKHQPYLRTEYATRPEYERQGAPGTPEFFRYEHGAHEIGATRWLINTVGYGYETSSLPLSVRPFVELQHNVVRAERGGIDPRTLYGERSFWSVSAGARIYFGGGAMRMGNYGALDPMAAAMRPGAKAAHGAH